MPVEELVKAEYDYNPTDAGELPFKEGDIIKVVAKHPSGWWTGVLNGNQGTFPSNFTVSYAAPSMCTPFISPLSPV